MADRFDFGNYVRKEGRDIFFKTLCTYAISNGMCLLWNADNVYDKSTCAMKKTTEAADYLALAEAAEAMDVYVPSEFSGEYVWSGTLKNSSYNQFATFYVDDSDWPYVDNTDVYANTWTFGNTVIIDASGAYLSGKQSLYFSLNGEDDFEGSIMIKIKEKK